MKNLLLLAVLVFGYSIMAKANESQVVLGELAVHGAQAEIYSKYGQITVDIDDETNSCFDGVFKVLNGRLIKVITCRDKGSMAQSFKGSEKADNVLLGIKWNFCPFYFSPVCCLVNWHPTTFGNDCELKNNGALKIYSGSCKDVESLTVNFKPVHNIEKY